MDGQRGGRRLGSLRRRGYGRAEPPPPTAANGGEDRGQAREQWHLCLALAGTPTVAIPAYRSDVA